jgi:DNA-binding LacI/PurR family transcriptional regulator
VVDGLVVSPWALTPADLRRRADGAPLVLLGEQGADGLFDHVAVDNVAAAREATRHLIGTGRTRIAAIGPQPHLHNETARQRLEGYHTALVTAGLPVAPALEVPVRALHRADGAAALRTLLANGAAPDAVFCFNDQLALGALRAASDLGPRVPDDLALVGFDDIEDGRYSVPSLTTVVPDKEAIAARALACLAERMGTVGTVGTAVPARRITVGHRLAVRESSGAGPGP